MKTITATVGAYINAKYNSMTSVLSGTPENAVSDMIFYEAPNGKAPEDWTLVGSAEVTVTLIDEGQINAAQVSALVAEKRRIQAECELAVTRIDGQIQSLLAIEHKSEVMA